MSVIINGISVPWNTDDGYIIAAALKKCSLPLNTQAAIYRTAVDARKRNDIKKAASVLVKLQTPFAEHKLAEKFAFCTLHEDYAPITLPPESKAQGGKRTVIAGFGPAGMFAALLLSRGGYKPLVLERGSRLSDRVKSVEHFWQTGVLDTESNVQFGEGGAGTFSDGKLTTRINDARVGYILKTFVRYGADEAILTQAKPHIGTDKLRGIIKNIRTAIENAGGEIRFNSRLSGIEVKNSAVVGVNIENGGSTYTEPADALILAVGHSARDTFEMLQKSGVPMSAKPFSVGVRIEHRQADVDTALYGENRSRYKNLPVGEYQLSRRFERLGNRAAYTFCMCPGGVVVPSQSEAGSIVTNGMSYHARDGENANAALCVSVSPDDFGQSPLAGVDFARCIERKAFEAVGGNLRGNPGGTSSGNSYKAPATTVAGFLSGKPTLHSAAVTPSYALGVAEADFNSIFPPFVIGTLKAGLADFSRKLYFFGDGGAVMTAPETRTSSPVRIERSENLTSPSIAGLFPCGEGAGFAGGIVSAAADGLKCAEAAAKF